MCLSECIEIYGDYGAQNCILDDCDHYHYYYLIFIISNEIMMISDNCDLISFIIIMIRYHNRHSYDLIIRVIIRCCADPAVSTWGCHQMRGRDESMVIEWVKSPIVTIFWGISIHKDPFLAIWG